MTQRIAADIVVLLHLTFILFVGFGALLSLRWKAAAWLHLPAVAWGVTIEPNAHGSDEPPRIMKHAKGEMKARPPIPLAGGY